MNKNDLRGKMIYEVSNSSINMWRIHFTDGSSVEVWAESDGPLCIPRIFLDKLTEPSRIPSENQSF
jgi:hypothetical protein